MRESVELEKVKREVFREADMREALELEKVKTKVVSGKQASRSLLNLKGQKRSVQENKHAGVC